MTGQSGSVPELRRVLVTGAAGIIGRAVVAELDARGTQVVAMSSTAPADWRTTARVVIADAADERALDDALTGCDAVVHLAALAHPSLGTPVEVFTNNVDATFTVLARAAAGGVQRAVIASSINAFGVPMNPHGPLPAYFPLDEELPGDVADAYSLSKRVDELSAAMAARTWGIDVVALRFPLVKADAELRHIAAEVAEDPVTMMRTGWSYLRLADAATAIIAALTAPVTGAHVVGLSAHDNLLWRPSADLVATYAPGVEVRRPLRGTESLIDTARAQRLLGLLPGSSIHEQESRPR